MTIHVQTFFDPQTATFTHVVHDVTTKKAAIIDPVLDYDPDSGRTQKKSIEKVLAYIQNQSLSVEWILETHVHADHITGAQILKKYFDAKIGIGDKIKTVLDFWIPIFNNAHDTHHNASQFDTLFHDGVIFLLGDIPVTVMHTPGHTPACVCYVMEDAAFVGDTIFMHDIGTARTDFPGGSADMLYDSIQKILCLPQDTRLFLCHDYPPQGRDLQWVTTVKDVKNHNILVRSGISKAEYVALRNQRDAGKPVPKLLLPSIQANLRAGCFGHSESNNIQYVKIPIDII